MPKSSRDSIRTLCRRRIAALRVSDDDPGRFENQIVRLVEENIARGRLVRLGSSHQLDLPDYVDNVIYYARSEGSRLLALAEGETTEWDQLRDFLRRRAYKMALRFRNSSQASADALDFAQQACLVIFAQRYPFDVSFDAWATTILKNLILERYTRSRDVLNQHFPPDALDTPQVSSDGSVSFLEEMIANPQSLAPFEKVENQMVLLDAIAQLRSQAQRHVIIWTYLDQLDDSRIAQQLHKNVQDVYVLRWRALARLKVILTKSSR